MVFKKSNWTTKLLILFLRSDWSTNRIGEFYHVMSSHYFENIDCISNNHKLSQKNIFSNCATFRSAITGDTDLGFPILCGRLIDNLHFSRTRFPIPDLKKPSKISYLSKITSSRVSSILQKMSRGLKIGSRVGSSGSSWPGQLRSH